MKARELLNLGIPKGDTLKTAIACVVAAAHAGVKKPEMRRLVAHLVSAPSQYLAHEQLAPLAQALITPQPPGAQVTVRAQPVKHRIWGEDLEPESVRQLLDACRLPVSVQGALMPDAHVGYGLPIGGVLATRGAVIPYAVGVDIACRMKMTVLDWPADSLEARHEALIDALQTETRFGVGATFKKRREHAVMDEDWRSLPVVRALKDKAWAQLGTSGSGNHFVEFGILEVSEDIRDEKGTPSARRGASSLAPGRYLALLSHSGSRGPGNELATHFSKVAREKHPHLPKELSRLAWLDLDDQAGQEYWQAMELMGRYAAANHELIHRHIALHLGAGVLFDVENHHNFAWKEIHGDLEVVVHRKGATPAHDGVLGIIPGSMATPGFLVVGKGEPASLCSASHGAGRRMSRAQAKRSFSWESARRLLDERGVTLLSAGLDEAPFAYKNIETVMAQQRDLVRVLARFDPKIVKMAPGNERPED